MDRPKTLSRISESALAGQTWVTRQGVFVDRIASAWLIQRFIDSRAIFKFVSAAAYGPRNGELRFDMYDGEFTHTNGGCTFESLLDHFGLSSPALVAIAQIVHDIDCKDEKFGRLEASGVEAILAGLVRSTSDDMKRIEAGARVFDGLYLQFGGRENDRVNL